MQKKNFVALLLGIGVFAGTFAGAARAENTKVCFEAESAHEVLSAPKKVTPGPRPDWSGAGYIHIPWDKNETKGKGSASYKLNVAKAGSYHVWARTLWENGCGNSISLVINGQERMLGEDGTYGKWHWVNSSTRIDLKAGENTVVLKNRETGVKIDQIFFCTDGEYTPTKIRPITHDGGTGKPVK